MNRKTAAGNFYPDLNAAIKQAEKELESVKIADGESDADCEPYDRRMVIKYGPYGEFLACPGLPECQNTKPYLEKIGAKCPKCSSELIRKRTGRGRIYHGYENSPTCEFMSWAEPSEKCHPKYGGYMIERNNKLVCTDEACGYNEMLGGEDKG